MSFQCIGCVATTRVADAPALVALKKAKYMPRGGVFLRQALYVFPVYRVCRYY
jgi:hypothetical protein